MACCKACEQGKPCSGGHSHKISGMKSSKVSLSRLGGLAVGYAGAKMATAKIPFLQGTTGGLVKLGGGIFLNMYSKPGSFLQGVGDGVFVQGIESTGTSLGVIQGLAPGRLGLSDTSRMRRLGSAIEGQGQQQRTKVYAKVA